jgi:hypothetical protein
MALGSTQTLTGMSTRSIPGGKWGRCVRLTTLPPSCAIVTKSGNLYFLEPSGPLQAFNGTTLPFSCTNFSNLFLEWNSTCFEQFLCPSSGVFHCSHSNGIYHILLQTACEEDQDGTRSSILILLTSCLQNCVTYTIAVWTVNNSRWWTEELPETCRISFQDKFQKLVHVIGFIIGIGTLNVSLLLDFNGCIILACTARLLSFTFSSQNCVCISPFPTVLHISSS